jgi:hypothetical protein
MAQLPAPLLSPIMTAISMGGYGWPNGLTRRFPWMMSHIRAGRPFIRTSC